MSTDTTGIATAPNTPQVAVNDIGSEADFLAAIDQTIKYFNDGDIVEGTIVKVDRSHVRLGIEAPEQVAILREELLLDVEERSARLAWGELADETAA